MSIPEKENQNIIFGRNAVFELFDTDLSVNAVYISESASSIKGRALALCKKKSCPLKEVGDTKLKDICGSDFHQGIVASVSPITYKSIEDILSYAKEKGESPFIVLLDEIEDPHNLGAIIRSAECAGAHGVVIEKRRSAQVNETVYKTSAGAALHLPIARVANLVSAINELKKNGVWITGADMNGQDYRKIDFDGAVGLIIGSEGKGISRLVRENCDFIASIPQFGKVNSLNASVAAGVLIYEVVRNRNKI